MNQNREETPPATATTKSPWVEPREVGSYYDAGKVLREDLLDGDAQSLAKQFGSAVSRTQIRRFFEQVKAIERSVDISGDDTVKDAALAQQLPRLLFLKAQAHHALSRGHVPKSFVQFIVDHVEHLKQIRTYREFQGFMRHFEAVLAFHYFLTKG